MEDNNQLIVDAMWEDLHNKGYFQKDKDTFDKFFFAPGEEGYNNRYKLWKDLHSKGYLESPTYEDFAARIGLQPVQKETTAPNGENGGMKLSDVQGTVMGGVAGGVEPGSYAQNFAYGLQEGADKNISLEDLRSDLETRRQKKSAEVQEQQDAAVGNVKQNEPEKSTIFGGGSSAGGGASTSSSRKSNIGYNKYTGILKTDPTTGEKYYTYPGYSQAQDTTNISELQGNNMVDEEGRVIGASGGTWSPKYIDDKNRLFLPGSSIWYDGGLNYRTPLDSHIAQAIDLGMKASDHSGMSVDQLKAKRNEILGKYSNGFTSSPESLQDAIDLNDIDYELTARSLNYNSKKEMLANRGHADYELNKARVNQDDLRFYERQGTNLDQNPLYVFGWQKLVEKIQNDQKMGVNANMTADGYIDYLMQDPNIESKFYAYTLYRASKNNRSWKENIDEVLDDFRESLERGENKHALAPDEKDVMAKYATGELDRMDADVEKGLGAANERYEQWRKGGAFGLGDTDPYQQYMHATGDIDIELFSTAKNLNAQTRTLVDEAMKGGGFINSSIRGLVNGLFSKGTWDFGVGEMMDAGNMKVTIDKVLNNPNAKLTPGEQALMDAVAAKTVFGSFFGKYLPSGYKAGETTAQAIPFIIEMATGIGETTQGLTKAVAKYTARQLSKYGTKFLERIGLKNVMETTLKALSKRGGRVFEKLTTSKVGRAITRAAESKVGRGVGKAIETGVELGKGAVKSAIGGVGYAATTGSIKTVGGGINRTIGTPVVTQNAKTGKLEVTGQMGAEEPFMAFMKEFGTQVGEYGSEMYGPYLERLTGGLKSWGKALGIKAADKMGIGKLVREIGAGINESDMMRIINDFKKMGHYDGTFNEYLEEVANNVYNAAFIKDMNWGTGENGVFNLKNNVETYLSCLYMSGLFGIPAAIGYRTPKYRARKDIERADEIAKRAFRGQDWGSLAASIRNGSDEQVQQLMVDIARSKKYNARQREAAIKYAGAVYALKGIEAGEPKKTPDTPAEGQLKEMYGRGYNMENYQAISDANGAYERAKQGVAWIPPEMLQMIDEEPAYVYEWVANNPNWSEQEKQQLFDYLNAKATYEGAQARLKDDEASIRADVESGIDQRTNKKNEDGTGGDNMIHPVVLKNGKRVYVTGGNVEQDSQGKVISDTNDLIVVDEDNNTSMITSKDIETVEEVESPDEQKQVANDAITQGLAETTDATATDVVDEYVEQGGEGADGAGAVGNYDGVLDAMGIEDDQARQALNETWGQTPPADAMDVLNDLMGENNPEQRESNKVYWAQQPEVFNSQWRYMMGDVAPDQVNAALAAQNEAAASAATAQPQAQAPAATQSQPQASTPAPQAAVASGHYEQDDDVVLNVGGEQITGFISNVLPDGKLRLQLDAPINGNVVVDVTPEELDKMVAQPQDSGANAALAPQDGTAASAPTTPTVPAAQPSQAAAPEAPQQESAQPSLPVGEDGNADFSNATPQEAHDYIYNDPELDEEEANQVVQNYADSAAEELAKAQAVLDELKSMPAPQMKDYGRDMAGYKRDKKERNDSIAQAQAAVDAAQREVDLWKDVQAQHMMVPAPDVTNQGVPASGEIEEGNVESGEAAVPAAPQEAAGETQAPASQEESSMLSANESGEPSNTRPNEGESGEETTPAAEEELTPDERIERARLEALESRAQELADSCGLPVQVARSLDDLSDSHRRQVEKQHAEGKYVNGFYDPKTKQIVLFMPDIAANGGMRRLERTFLHEGVAHGGLRALFENAQNGIQTFDELCDQVWEMMPVADQTQMMNYIGVKKPEDMTQEKKRIAADEYMAHLAEWGVEQSVKSRIINAIKNALRKIGVKMRLNNNDIVSLLAASRRHLNEMDKVGINSAISEALDNDGESDGEGVRMSTTAIFEGAGLEVSRDATDNEGKPTKEPLTDNKGNLVARIGDKEYSVDNPVTAADLKEGNKEKRERTVLQMLINDARAAMNITEKQADKIYQNYADLINMYLYMGRAIENDPSSGPEAVISNWEWLGDSVFRTIAANGDAQYSYSMDIIRVCKKNEAVIKAMSALQLREGRGATPSEIVELYRETHEDGYQVPCPVCYVFTRYIRNGKYASAAIKGMEKWGDHLPGGSDVWNVDQWLDALDKIQRETNPDYKPDGKNKMKGEELEKAKRFKKQLDQANKITVAYEKRVNALSYLLTTDDAIKAGTIKNKKLELTPERRASIEKELDIINEQYQHAVEIIAHQALSNWIKTHAIEEKEGKWQMREDAKKPEDIDDYKRNALDLRLTSNTIVNYPAIQRLRKSGGSAAGKEISFASDNRLGEVVSGLGINKTNLSGYKNKYEEALNATGSARTKARNEARKRFKDATVYALMQTLRGGQRMWSWSDNIERLSPDIAINIMQLQLLGGAMQTYSKQLEGIKLAAQMGAYVNGSLMAKDNGYQEVTDKDIEERDGKLWLNHDIPDEVEEYPVGGGEPKPRKRIVAAKGSYVYQAEDGKKYVLIYDDVVGVDPFGNELHGKGKKKGLFQLNQEYDRAGNILVGMNDLHVRAAMADPRVFFIIPWHASGANNHILNQMLNILEQTMTDRLDYTAMQEEKNMLERNKKTKELPEVNQRLRDLWEEGRQWAEQNKWKSGMEVDSNGDVITESQYMYRQLRAQIFNGNIFEAMPSEEQYRAAVQTVESMQPTVDAIAARNEAWKAKSPEYKKSPEGKAEKKAIEQDKNRTNKKYKEVLHYIELHDGLIDWRDSSQHEGDAEWQEQHPKRINVEEARRMIENDEFLSQVLKRVEPIGHMTNGDNTYIYPYEYWQETDEKGNPADIKDADINGKRYVEYCRRMGYKPKFSGRWGDKVTEENMNDGNFVHDPGYWKLLIDRRMYDRKGKYQWLDPVESENFEPDLVNPLKTGEEFNITQVADDKDAEDIAERVYNNMAERDGGVAKVDYSKPLDKIMDEYDAALAAGVQANVKLTEAEEDALDDMEEAMAEEGEDSGVMFSTSPTFYSNAERAVENIKQNKATAEQWKAMLTKAGGIKSGEDKWMGLSTWLDDNKGKSLTKDEVLQFVRDNGIQMEEVEYVENKRDEDANPPYEINGTRIDYTTEGLKNLREIAFKVPNIESYQEHDEVHFGPENQGKAVMWVRFGETTDADGKRVLVIDEIQSNRHQDAREKGYRKSIEDYRNSGYRVERNSSNNGNLIYDKDGNFIELVYDNERPQGVPAAPFEKNWHEVAMKRMLRLAAEEGFDKVAWTTGEQQVERYGLEKVLSSINSSDWGDNIGIEDTKVVTLDYKGEGAEDLIVDRNGNIVADVDDRYINKTLADVVGKEMAGKLMADGEVTISGNGLRIGGEGMKGFYDQMLPRFMDKYGKRWGVKTGTVELPNVEEAGRTMHSVDVTPEMKESVMQGQPLFSIGWHGSGSEFDRFDHSHMGEGEGAQAYGWGTYITSVEGIGRSYATESAKNNPTYYWKEQKIDRASINPLSMAYDVVEREGTIKKAISLVDRFLDNPDAHENWTEVKEILKQSKKSDFTIKPARYLYEVDIPDNNGENYISWNETLPKKHRRRIANVVRELPEDLLQRDTHGPNWLRGGFEQLANTIEREQYAGKEITERLRDALGNSRVVSEVFSKAGFVGTEYPAQYLSGGRKDGAKNYVIYNEDDVEIKDRIRFSTSAAVDALKDDERVYNDLLGKVFSGVSNETRRGIVGDAMENRGYDFGAATEAWLMGLADDETFAQVPQEDWRAVKNALGNALRENGVEGSMTDNEARYVLWKAGQIEDGVFSMAEDIVKRDELLNGANAPQYTDNADVRFSTSPAEQIYSDNFKNWFGDWENDPENASKVVDENGRPKVVYHQTNRKQYINKKTGQNWDDLDWRERDEWDNRSDEEWEDTWEEQDFYTFDNRHGRQSIEYPAFFFAPEEDPYHEYGERTIAVYLDIKNPAIDPVIPDAGVTNTAGRDAMQALIDQGYDGVIRTEDGVPYEYIAFYPEQIKSATENNGDFSRENPDIRFSVTPRDRAIARDQYDRMMRSGRYQFVEAVQDSMLGLKKLMEAIMGDSYEYIEDIPMYENPYITENLMSSSNAAQQHEYSNRLMAPILKEINKLTKGKNKARNELIDYMMAKHGLERNQVLADRDAKETAEAGGDYQEAYAENRERDYAGLTALTGEDDVHAAEAKAQQMVAAYEQQHDTTELWGKVNAATKTTLAKLYQCGIMSKETYQKTRDMFEYYIPLRGWDEKTSDKVYGYLTSKDGPLTGGSIMKRAGGRTSKADDPIATIAMMADKAIREGNRNLMKQTFLNFVRNHPSDAVSVSELWLQYDATKDEWVPVFPDIPADASPAEVEQITEQFEADMQQLAQQEPDKYKHGRETANIPYKVIPGNEREHQVLVKMRGQTYVLTINGNPRAAQALNGVTNPDVEATKVLGKILDAAQGINRWMSSVYTTKNPDFVVSNFLRDMYYANTMVYVKEKGNYGVRFNANVAKLNPLTIYYLLRKWENGTLNENRRIEKLFKEFMLNGGETGYTTVWDVERYKKSITKELRKQNNITLKAMGTLGGQLEMFNRSVENVARFAAFVTSVEMGRSYGRAAYDAKEISVNFNKKGSGGTMFGATGQTFLGNVGAAVSSVGRQFFVFWNAGVQGMTNFGRNTKRHPVKGGLGAASLFGLGILIPLLAGAGGGDGDDEDKNAYYNLPEYIRRSNLCIYADGKWVTIPLPVEYRAIYGLGELAYGVVAGKERYSDEELAMQISSQFSQLLPIDMLEGGGGWHPFIPTLLKPIVETGTNTSWSGLPIHPDSPFDDGKYMPEYTKVYQSTDKDLIRLSEFLNRVTGGNGRKKGMVDINPANIEYWLNGYLGGLFTFPIKVKKSAETAFGDREFEWKNIPFANRVIKEGDERTEAKKLKNEFFKYKEEYEETKWRLQGYGKDTDQGVFNYAKELADMNYSKEYGRYVIFDKYAKEFEDLEKIKKRIADGTLPAEMKQEYDAEDMRLKRQLVQEMHAYEDGKYTPDRPKAEDQYKPKKEETNVTIQRHASSFDEVRMVDEFSNIGNQYKPANNNVMAEAQKVGMKMRFYKEKDNVKHELGLSGSTWNLNGEKSAEKKRFYNSNKALLDRVARYRWRDREIGRLMDEAKEKKSKEASNYKRIYQIIQDDIKDEKNFRGQ